MIEILEGIARESNNAATRMAFGRQLLQVTPHDLHVVLRHRLLRKPSGFEGLVLIPEDLTPCDLALSDPEHRPVAEFYRDAAARAAPVTTFSVKTRSSRSSVISTISL
jgi:hypothetical protein